MIEWIIIIFLGSALVFFGLYIKYLIKQIKNITSDVVVIREFISDYELALKSIYETEMFYGDATLQSLVEHTRDLVADLNNIVDDYEFEGPELLDEEDQEV